jgi:hypothetical protein
MLGNKNIVIGTSAMCASPTIEWIGREGVKERIDLTALSLLLKADIKDLVTYDACYVPPASPVWEPVNIAASQTAKLTVRNNAIKL